MGKIFQTYQNKLDRVWHDSSTVLYSECDDHEDALKTVRVTFKNGSTYEYKDVSVNDYLLFRESESSGRAFQKYIKQYPTTKIEPIDPALINEELEKAKEFDVIVIKDQSVQNEWAISNKVELTYRGQTITQSNVTVDEITKLLEFLNLTNYIIK